MDTLPRDLTMILEFLQDFKERVSSKPTNSFHTYKTEFVLFLAVLENSV